MSLAAIKKNLSPEFKERCRWTWYRVRHVVMPPRKPENPEGRVYVHLGCGWIQDERFINVDARPWPHVHHVSAVERLPMFADRSADLIYVCHCLEHISFLDVPTVLVEWKRVLKPGGWLRISVPDFDNILAIYEDNDRKIESIELTLMGGQTYEFNFHKSLFNAARLTSLLEQAGYTEVRRWEHGTDEFAKFPDWSGKCVVVGEKRYPISLNLEARCPESA